MAIDDSFKKPGAIPFKWEIRPGVPKVPQQSNEHLQQQAASSDQFFSLFPQQQQQLEQQTQPQSNQEFSFPDNPKTLAPPPAGLYFQAPMKARTGSFRSVPRTRSERYRFYSSSFAQPVSVSSGGCFPSPLLGRKNGNRRTMKPKHKPEHETTSEPDSPSDLETLSRWSVSTRKSFSPFRDSPSSSSFSSYKSSSQPVNDADWAGFGLF